MQSFSLFSLESVLLVSIEEDIEDSEIRRLQQQVSELVGAGDIYGVILDLQYLEVMDSYFAGLMAAEQNFPAQRLAEVRLMATELAQNHLDHRTRDGRIRVSSLVLQTAISMSSQRQDDAAICVWQWQKQ